MIFKFLLAVSLLVFFSTANLIALGNKADMAPIKVSKIRLVDHELLVYDGKVGGEDTYRMTTVASLEDNPDWGKCVRLYEFISSVKEPRTLPTDLNQFDGFYLISLEKGSTIEVSRNFTNYTKTRDKRYPLTRHFKMNKEFTEMEYTEIYWDGFESKTKKSRIPVKPNYPTWDLNSLIMAGLRFLDLQSGGILYAVEPSVLKDPMPANVRFIKKEIVETPAGKFNTIKVAFSVADPFIGKLVSTYTKDTFVWIEESGAMRLVKLHSAMGEDVLLTKISSFPEVKKPSAGKNK